MKKFFQLAWLDIKNRQNIELYLTLVAAIIVFIVNIVNNKSRYFEQCCLSGLGGNAIQINTG